MPPNASPIERGAGNHGWIQDKLKIAGVVALSGVITVGVRLASRFQKNGDYNPVATTDTQVDSVEPLKDDSVD